MTYLHAVMQILKTRGQQPSLQIFYELVTRYSKSADQFFFPNKDAETNTQRRQLEVLLDSMKKDGLEMIPATAHSKNAPVLPDGGAEWSKKTLPQALERTAKKCWESTRTLSQKSAQANSSGASGKSTSVILTIQRIFPLTMPAMLSGAR